MPILLHRKYSLDSIKKYKDDPAKSKLYKHIGEKIGIYTIIDVSNPTSNPPEYLARCTICGETVTKTHHHLVECSKKCCHRGIKNKRLIGIYSDMKRRCYNSNRDDYKWYGAKGIRVCDEWINGPDSFKTWAYRNGYTDNKTLDRIDSSKDYCPENCRWIALEENARLATTKNWFYLDGEKMSIGQISDILKIRKATLYEKIKKLSHEAVQEYIDELYKMKR